MMGLPMQIRPQSQKGIALVSVLISIAIITGLVSSLAYQQFIQSRRAGVVLHREQAIMYLYAVESYAKILLNIDSTQFSTDWFGPEEPWGRGISNDFEGGTVQADIIELDGRFNLNNLRRIPSEEEINSGGQDVNLRSVWHNCYVQLLKLSEDEGMENPQVMVETVEDWLDPDVVARSNGAEDAYYQSPTDLGGSYKPSNYLLGNVQELALIKGYQELFAEGKQPKLLRQLTVLPSSTTTININTATNNVLQCLEPEGKLTAEMAEFIRTQREQKPFEKVADFIQTLDEKYPTTKTTIDEQGNSTEQSVSWKELLPVKHLDVRSRFALLRSKLTFGNSNLVAFTWLQRTEDGAVRVLRRSFVPS